MKFLKITQNCLQNYLKLKVSKIGQIVNKCLGRLVRKFVAKNIKNSPIWSHWRGLKMIFIRAIQGSILRERGLNRATHLCSVRK